MNQQSKRATYEDVAHKQEIILDFINRCMSENRPLNVSERKKFIKNLQLATLGIGTEYNFMIKGEKRSYNLRHVEHAAYWIAYQDETPVKIGDEYIEIKKFWLILRDYLFLIFPHAIKMAVKISQEQIKIGTAKASDV